MLWVQIFLSLPILAIHELNKSTIWDGIESNKIDLWVGWEDTNIVQFLNELDMNSSWNTHSNEQSANANRRGIFKKLKTDSQLAKKTSKKKSHSFLSLVGGGSIICFAFFT